MGISRGSIDSMTIHNEPMFMICQTCSSGEAHFVFLTFWTFEVSNNCPKCRKIIQHSQGNSDGIYTSSNEYNVAQK